MKKKDSIHPKLFTEITQNGNFITLSYCSNKFDKNGNRLINSFTEKMDNEIYNYKSLLYRKNNSEYQNLINYIKIQKKVLDKHQKSRNYESCKVVESSILLMQGFKIDFEIWLKKNMVLM